MPCMHWDYGKNAWGLIGIKLAVIPAPQTLRIVFWRQA